MATIRKYRGKINVQIRKKGYPFISKSFVSLTVAKKWAAATEANMERRLHVVIPDDTTVRESLERYISEVLPTLKSPVRFNLSSLLVSDFGFHLLRSASDQELFPDGYLEWVINRASTKEPIAQKEGFSQRSYIKGKYKLSEK
jgi:hypothetical protein